MDAVVALLADDASFNSPVTFKPFEGRDAVEMVLRAAFEVFEDFRYIHELTADDGTQALIFEARVGDRQVQGIDLLEFGSDGRIENIAVMVRPMSGVHALADEMGKQLGMSSSS